MQTGYRRLRLDYYRYSMFFEENYLYLVSQQSKQIWAVIQTLKLYYQLEGADITACS